MFTEDWRSNLREGERERERVMRMILPFWD
jgi:hypothetical protein